MTATRDSMNGVTWPLVSREWEELWRAWHQGRKELKKQFRINTSNLVATDRYRRKTKRQNWKWDKKKVSLQIFQVENKMYFANTIKIKRSNPSQTQIMGAKKAYEREKEFWWMCECRIACECASLSLFLRFTRNNLMLASGACTHELMRVRIKGILRVQVALILSFSHAEKIKPGIEAFAKSDRSVWWRDIATLFVCLAHTKRKIIRNLLQENWKMRAKTWLWKAMLY